MSHLNVVTNRQDAPTETATTLPARPILQCCPAGDPWIDINPHGLGYTLALTGRTAAEFAQEVDREARNDDIAPVRPSNALQTITKVMAGIDTLNDHDLRHVLEGIYASIRTGIHIEESISASSDHIHGRVQTRVHTKTPSTRIRIHRPRKPHSALTRRRSGDGAEREVISRLAHHADIPSQPDRPTTSPNRRDPMTTTNNHATTPTNLVDSTESLIPLGHTLVAFHNAIDRDLNDHNYTSADHHTALYSHLAESIDHVTDAQARDVLTGILRALRVRHTVAREDTALPDTPPETFFPGTTCGHRHTIGNYANGCAHATHTAWAITAAHEGDHTTAAHHALIADRTLWPLADINNPDSLRDFIAGNASGFETHLRSLGPTITT